MLNAFLDQAATTLVDAHWSAYTEWDAGRGETLYATPPDGTVPAVVFHDDPDGLTYRFGGAAHYTYPLEDPDMQAALLAFLLIGGEL